MPEYRPGGSPDVVSLTLSGPRGAEAMFVFISAGGVRGRCAVKAYGLDRKDHRDREAAKLRKATFGMADPLWPSLIDTGLVEIGGIEYPALRESFVPGNPLELNGQPQQGAIAAIAGEADASRPVPAQRVLAFAEEALTALSRLAACGVAHGDLNLSNVLVENPELIEGALRGESRMGVRLIDFGLSRAPAEPLSRTATIDRRTPGTFVTLAPECLPGGSYYYACRKTKEGDVFWRDSPRADVWSLGSILYYMATRRWPAQDACEEAATAYAANPVAMPSDFDEDYKNLAAPLSRRKERAVGFLDWDGLEGDQGARDGLRQVIALMLSPDPSRRPDACTLLPEVQRLLRPFRGRSLPDRLMGEARDALSLSEKRGPSVLKRPIVDGLAGIDDRQSALKFISGLGPNLGDESMLEAGLLIESASKCDTWLVALCLSRLGESLRTGGHHRDAVRVLAECCGLYASGVALRCGSEWGAEKDRLDSMGCLGYAAACLTQTLLDCSRPWEAIEVCREVYGWLVGKVGGFSLGIPFCLANAAYIDWTENGPSERSLALYESALLAAGGDGSWSALAVYVGAVCATNIAHLAEALGACGSGRWARAQRLWEEHLDNRTYLANVESHSLWSLCEFKAKELLRSGGRRADASGCETGVKFPIPVRVGCAGRPFEEFMAIYGREGLDWILRGHEEAMVAGNWGGEFGDVVDESARYYFDLD